MEVCEDHGIKIGLVDGHPDFDALTLLANDNIPVIALRRDMPGNPLPPEKPQRFERLVMHALYEGIISQARTAELLNVPLDQFLGGEVERYGVLP
jgi:hypothetical protein